MEECKITLKVLAFLTERITVPLTKTGKLQFMGYRGDDAILV